MPLILRRWATPLVIAAFLVSAVTGLLLFFHLETGLNKPAHEWIGLIFVAGGIFHVFANWPLFTGYFKKVMPAVVIAIGGVILVASFFAGGTEGGPSGVRAMIAALGNARLSIVAELAGVTPDALAAEVTALGYAVPNADATVADIAGSDGEARMRVLEAAFDAD